MAVLMPRLNSELYKIIPALPLFAIEYSFVNGREMTNRKVNRRMHDSDAIMTARDLYDKPKVEESMRNHLNAQYLNSNTDIITFTIATIVDWI